MATTTIDIPSSASLFDIQERLRDKEDLFFRLIRFAFNPGTGSTSFTFETNRDEPPPGPDELLGLELHPNAQTDEQREAVRQAFADFGGTAVADGVMGVD